jgi:hypothetical protein
VLVDGFGWAEVDRRVARAVSVTIVAEGRTDRLRFEGWQGFGLRVGVLASGTIRGLPGWRFLLDEQAVVRPLQRRVDNWGVTTIETPLGELLLRFRGRVHGLRPVAEGECSLEGKSGAMAGWRSEGTYIGPAGLSFHVSFSLTVPDDLAGQFDWT